MIAHGVLMFVLGTITALLLYFFVRQVRTGTVQ
jgi:hypothetical protein